jgi:hypothetical protein
LEFFDGNVIEVSRSLQEAAVKERPKDIIDHIEEIAGKNGRVAQVDHGYYEAFISLSDQEFERLAVALMIDQIEEVRRLANDTGDPVAIERVSRFVINGIRVISTGMMVFDRFGRLGGKNAVTLTAAASFFTKRRRRLFPALSWQFSACAANLAHCDHTGFSRCSRPQFSLGRTLLNSARIGYASRPRSQQIKTHTARTLS